MKKLFEKISRVSWGELKEELCWVWKYIKKYKRYVLLYVIFGFVSIEAGLAGSVLSKKLINAVTGLDSSSIFSLAVLYIIFGFINILLTAALSRISAFSSANVTQNIRTDVFSAVIRSDWHQLTSFHSGDVLNRVNNDVSAVANGVLNWLPTLVTKLFQFVGAFFLIFYYDKSMALIALAASPVTVAVSMFFLGKLRENSSDVKKASSSLMAFLGETFHENSVVKAFNLADVFENRFKTVQSALTASVLKQNRLSVVSSAAVSAVGLLVSYACFGWSIYRLWSGAIDFGTMVMFIQLAGFLSSAFGSLVSLLPNAVASTVAAGRVIEITKLKTEEIDETAINKLIRENQKSGIKIEAESIKFGYSSESNVLIDFSLSAVPNEIAALSGKSGAGKTTVLRLLLGLLESESGKADLIGLDSGERIKISPSTRKAFTYVPQGHSLFSGTIRENMLMLNSSATDEEIYCALEAACAEDFVSAMPEKLETHLGEDNHGLSEGQAQRIAVARAILADSPIILLDEATSAIDAETEKRIFENIAAMAEKKTVIVTTHKQSVLNFSNKVYHVEKL